MNRGDIVTVATGKPRPAIVVQSDHLLPYPMVIVVPFTSEIDEVAAATPLSPAAEVPAGAFAFVVINFSVARR